MIQINVKLLGSEDCGFDLLLMLDDCSPKLNVTTVRTILKPSDPPLD